MNKQDYNHQHLFNFYDVKTEEELIYEMEMHILKLQKRLKTEENYNFVKVREG